MKYLFTLILAASFLSGSAQFGEFEINFDDTLNLSNLRIDTVGNPDNSWQIGTPSKVGFGTAFSIPRVIATDTLNSYPVNDNSSFTVWHIASQGYMMPHTATIAGQYQVNSDSLNDYGLIEFSPDNGVTWVDLLHDTAIRPYIWWSPDLPVLSGRSFGWESFYVNIAQLGPYFGVQMGDTVLYRFSFHSDATYNNLPGLMFDDLDFMDYAEGIGDKTGGRLVTLFPNPATDEINLVLESPPAGPFDLVITNACGTIISMKNGVKDRTVSVNLSGVAPGMYFYRIVRGDGKPGLCGKFIKNNY